MCVCTCVCEVGDSEQDMYFFSNYNNGCGDEREKERRERGTPCGFWKATGSSKQINSSKKMPIVGIRKSFVFYRFNHGRTDWIMHQYCISLSENPNCLVRIGDWSLCRVYLKKRSTRAEAEEEDCCSASSSSSLHSDSSIFTEVSSSSKRT